jgi:hypothetical protein
MEWATRATSATMNKPANSALQRAVEHCGRPVLAMDCALAGAELASWLAAELNR